jgi:hypothetical protein
MFLRSLELAIFKEKSIKKKLFQFYGKEKDFLDHYILLDDSSIYDLVLKNCDKSKLAYQIMDDLKNRRLFKRAYYSPFANIPPITRMNI